MADKRPERAGPPKPLTPGVRLTIRIDFDERRSLGHGKIKLLELIDRFGSIAAAARDMDMSYRRAWILVQEVSTMFREPIVERQIGGKGGGSARLTVFGRAMVQIYRSIQTVSLDVCTDRIAALQANLKADDEADARPSELLHDKS